MSDEGHRIETPFDGGDSLHAAALHLDALQKRCNEAIEMAKRAQAQVLATQQVLSQHIARMRGLLVHVANGRRGDK